MADHGRPAPGTETGTARISPVRGLYARRGIWGLIYGNLFAERGFQVVLQSDESRWLPRVAEHPPARSDQGLAKSG